MRDGGRGVQSVCSGVYAVSMTPAEAARILALCEGRPVGEACLANKCATHIHYQRPMGYTDECTCAVCNGTGRIHTAPHGEVEIGVHGLRRRFDAAKRERDEALARAERAEALRCSLKLRGQGAETEYDCIDAHIMELQAQRDRLAAALRWVSDHVECCRRGINPGHTAECPVGAALREGTGGGS